LSLWSTLHDGDLTAIESDLLARTLTLRFDVGYVRDFHNVSEESLFVVTVKGVQSVRSFSSVPWPGGCSIPSGTPYEQQEAIVAEYHSKWREESLSWADFERLSSSGLEVSSAELGQGPDGVALRLGLLVGGDNYVEAYVRGEEITFSVGNAKSHHKSSLSWARRTGKRVRKGGTECDVLVRGRVTANEVLCWSFAVSRRGRLAARDPARSKFPHCPQSNRDRLLLRLFLRIE
jgi:hypothetical protein